MRKLEELSKVIVTDVLVIGHGISGLSAAITAKEEAPELDVLTVDKSFVGYAGKANKGGGHVAFIPEGNEEKYVEYHTRNCGDYLNDQDMLRIYAKSTVETIKKWESWGVKFTIDRDHAQNAHPIIPWKICILDGDMMIKMGSHAKKIGVKSHEKVTITELIKDGDKVVGAFGMSLLTGETYVYKAKSVILSCGDQNWSVAPMWTSGKGDGIAAAYRAGAKMRNAEFGSFINLMTKSSKTIAYGAEDCLVNGQGKSCTERDDLDENLKSVVGGVDLGGAQSVLMYLDVLAGKGPIYENLENNHFIGSFIGRNLCCYGGDADPPFYRPVTQKFWNKLYFKNRLESMEDKNAKLVEVIPALVGECSPVYVDHHMATSLTGLFSSGDACACGSAWSGAVPTPPGRNRGSGLLHAVLTGIRAAKSAADFAKGAELGNVSSDAIEGFKNTLFAPSTGTGDMTPQEFLFKIKEIMQPVENSGYKSEDRLRRSLNQVLELKNQLGRIKADDPHNINAANECRSTILCAEMFFRASLERKESRGWHLREDFKNRDDQNFSKWIVLKDNNGEMEVSYEDIPMEGYKYQPESSLELV